MPRVSAPSTPDDTPDKDQPLRDDIRMLGRLLGDAIRAQEGEAVYDTVETIRQSSIRFRRDHDAPAAREVQAILDGLSPGDTVQIIRAFSYFSHLANIAEDQHHSRRARAHALTGSGPRPGSLARAIETARAAGLDTPALVAFFGGALVSPVLTAHPSEVRRRSTMALEDDIASALAERERATPTPEEDEALRARVRRAVLTLWQTSLLRKSRLSVFDEVMNGLSYYDATFLRELPALYCALEDRLATPQERPALASFLRIGSWIGGDRDGNPFVDADVLTRTMKAQSARAFAFYAQELTHLKAELPLGNATLRVTNALRDLAERSPDASPHRRHEPYRRAVIGIQARLAATRDRLQGTSTGAAEPYASTQEVAADLATLTRSPDLWRAAGGGRRAAAHPRARRRLLRVPPGGPRPAPELRRPRTGRGRTARGGSAGHRLSGAGRGGARRAPGGGTRDRPAARLALPHLRRGDDLGTRPPARDRAGPRALRAGRDPDLHHLQGRGRLRPPRTRGAAEGGRASSAKRARRSTSCLCSRRSRTFGAARRRWMRRSRCRRSARSSPRAATRRR